MGRQKSSWSTTEVGNELGNDDFAFPLKASQNVAMEMTSDASHIFKAPSTSVASVPKRELHFRFDFNSSVMLSSTEVIAHGNEPVHLLE